MEIVKVTAQPSSACPQRQPRPLWNAYENLVPNHEERCNGAVDRWRPAVLLVFADENERHAWVDAHKDGSQS